MTRRGDPLLVFGWGVMAGVVFYAIAVFGTHRPTVLRPISPPPSPVCHCAEWCRPIDLGVYGHQAPSTVEIGECYCVCPPVSEI